MRMLGRVFVALILLGVLLPACGTHSKTRTKMVDAVRVGAYSTAYKEFGAITHKASRKDYVMNQMDRALLLQKLGRYKESIDAMESAKARLDDLFGKNIGEELAAIAWNDAQLSFQGEEFERVMMHMVEAFSYMHLGNVTEAAVEARQINHRLQVWADRLEKNNVKTSYKQDPFAQYLAGILQEAMGENNDAFRSYEDAVIGYDTVGPLMGMDVPGPLQRAVIRAARRLGYEEKVQQYVDRFGDHPRACPENWENKARLVVIVGLGEVAHKVSEKWIVPDPELDTIVVTYPEFRRGTFQARQARVAVAGRKIAAIKVHDLSTLAITTLNDKNAQVKARAIAKAIMRYAIKKATKAVARHSDNTAAQATSLIANIALNVYDMVETADTRSWMTLPDHYRMVDIPVEPGTRDVTVTVAGPGMHDVQRFVLPFVAGETRFLVVRGREGSPQQKEPPPKPVDALDEAETSPPETIPVPSGPKLSATIPERRQP